EDTENIRTQQFLLRWCPGPGHSFRDIVRQEGSFSSGGAVREIEDYAVELFDVQVLELLILPDKRDSEVRASLLSFRLAGREGLNEAGTSEIGGGSAKDR